MSGFDFPNRPVVGTTADEGTNTAAVDRINFVGGGVTAVASAGTLTVTVPTGAGGVTSVTAASPLASSGGATPQISVANQNANIVLAGPAAAPAAAPTFRSLVSDDIPALAESKITNLTTDLAAKAATATTVTGASGVSGGGDLSANRTLTLDVTYAPTWTAAHIHLNTSVGTAQTPMVTVQNTTAATNGAQKFSPVLEFEGRGWETTGGTSQTAKMGLQLRPVQGAALTSDMVWWSSINGAAYSEILRLSSAGFFYHPSEVYFQGGATTWIDLTSTNLKIGLASADRFLVTSTAISPATDSGLTSGTTAKRWTSSHAMQYASASQTLSWSTATPTAIDPALGDICLITLTANITAWSISNGVAPGQFMFLKFIQGAAAPWTLGADSNAANILIAGGSFTLSVTAGNIDMLMLVWDGTNWLECGRALLDSR